MHQGGTADTDDDAAVVIIASDTRRIEMVYWDGRGASYVPSIFNHVPARDMVGYVDVMGGLESSQCVLPKQS